MGNLVGVVAAISAGGAGAVFWMWLLALLGSSTAFAEGTLAQIYRQKDPLYGGYRGGPAYYIHDFMTKKKKKKQNGPAKEKRYSLIAVLFAISGLICWCGISQVISNSVSSAMKKCISHSAAVHHDLPRRCELRLLFFAKMPPFTSWMSLFQSWPAVIS